MVRRKYWYRLWLLGQYGPITSTPGSRQRSIGRRSVSNEKLLPNPEDKPVRRRYAFFQCLKTIFYDLRRNRRRGPMIGWSQGTRACANDRPPLVPALPPMTGPRVFCVTTCRRPDGGHTNTIISYIRTNHHGTRSPRSGPNLAKCSVANQGNNTSIKIARMFAIKATIRPHGMTIEAASRKNKVPKVMPSTLHEQTYFLYGLTDVL